MEKPNLKIIKVSNLPPDATEDTVRFFFENKKKSGGGDIENLKFDSESNTAVITFDDDEVAERVVSRLPLLLNKKNIDVEILKPQQSSLNPGDENKEPIDVPEFGIEVRGMKPTTSEDTILYYFEGRKGADADVVHIKFLKEEEKYILWFEEDVAIETVLKKQHKIDGHILEVNRYIEPPPVPKYENKVFITNINPTTTKDGLESFLEARARVSIEEIIFGEVEGTALVTFEEQPDIGKLKTACMKRAFEKNHLQIQTVAVSDCVVVSGFSRNTSSDTLEFYFDNEKRSGVTGVRDVKLTPGDETCLVFFEDPQSALDVCKKKHTIDGRKLTVHVYYECLGQATDGDDRPKFKPLKPITIENVNARKLEFIINSKQNKSALQKQIDSLYAEVDWPQQPENSLEVRCTLTENVRDCHNLANTWAKSVISEVEKFLDTLAVEEVETLKDAWDDVSIQLKIAIQNKEGVVVREVKEDQKIVIIGYNNAVKDVESKIKSIVQNVEEQLEKRKQSVTEEMKLNMFETSILMQSKFIEALKQEYSELQIQSNEKDLKVIFTGISSQVTAAKIKVYEKVREIVGVNAGNFSSGFLRFLNQQDVKSYVEQQMKTNNILGVWNTNEANLTSMYSLSDEEAVSAVKILKDSIIEMKIQLDANQSTIINLPEWKREIREIEKEFKTAKVQIIVDDSKNVFIYQTSEEDEGIVKEKVSDAFLKYAIQDVEVPLSFGQSRLLREQFRQELDMLHENCTLKNTRFTIDNNRVQIQGSSHGTSFAKTEIDNMIQNIVKTKHTINKAGIVKYMGTEQGKSKISKVEKNNKVVIEVEGEDGRAVSGSKVSYDGNPQQWKEIASFTTPSGQVIKAVLGNILDIEVDVLVNPANKELEHAGGLAKALVEKGGISIQTECYEHLKRKGRRAKMVGEIFCSSAGKLKCKMIVHAVGPVWQDGSHKEDEYLDQCIWSALEAMDEKKYQSIAIPALCAGTFGYPVDKATKVIIESIKNYLKEKTNDTQISKICLCDMEENTVHNFVSALQKFFESAPSAPNQRRRAARRAVNAPSQRRSSPVYVAAPANNPASHITVTLVKGQMAMQEVDVIVNTTSNTLQLNSGAVSASLLKLGGQSLQDECTQNYPNGIQFGEVATTSGGKLECKLICHGALPGWDESTSPKIVEDFMKNCLQAAEDKGHVSVAFPALGTGNLAYPKNKAAAIMFSSVEKFGKSHPGGSVCDVRFIVYEKDTATIKAFEEEQRKRRSGESTDRAKRKLESTIQPESDDQSDFDKDLMDGKKQASVDIGSITLKVYQGDITEADVGVIVNGTNRELDLTRGAVSKAILGKGGKALKDIMNNPLVKKQMKKDGFAVTNATRKFNFEYIIHTDMENTTQDLKGKFKTALEKADGLDKHSVAFPALGASFSYSVEDVAESLYEALISFGKQNSNVQEVHVIIYKQDEVYVFKSGIEKCLQKNKSQGFLSKIIFGAKHDPSSGQQWKVTNMQKSVLNLVIFAKDRSDSDSAIRSLEDSMETDFREKVVEDDILKELSIDQKAEITRLQAECEVEIELKERIGRIKVRGLIENVADATDRIHHIIKTLDRKKQTQQHAKLVADMVQWYFLSVEDTGQKLEEYPPEVNLILEQALRNNNQEASFVDSEGNKFVVDLDTYKEFPEDDPNDKVDVLRKSKLTDSVSEIPSNWVPMDSTENIKIVNLQSSDQEYSDVLENFKTQMKGNFNAVTKIEKIQNKTLYQQYVAKKKQMDASNGPGYQNERTLWHGTALEAVDSINTYGFNRSYCGKNAVAYGNGVYFAVDPSYSAQSQYSRPDPNLNKRMYMCKVLVGEFTKGSHGMKVPPPKPGAAAAHILYDSVVDNESQPSIFVIFHDTQALPEYLIVFN